MSQSVAWLLSFSDVDPSKDVVSPRHWWSGEGDLVFEGVTYRGASGPNGQLLEISDVSHTIDLPSARAQLQVAATAASVRHALSVNFGAVRVEVGWIWTNDPWLPQPAAGRWNRIPRRFIGRLSKPRVKDGVMLAEIETLLGDTDRGTPAYWSDATQRARVRADRTSNAADAAFAQASALAGDFDLRWPPSN